MKSPFPIVRAPYRIKVISSSRLRFVVFPAMRKRGEHCLNAKVCVKYCEILVAGASVAIRVKTQSKESLGKKHLSGEHCTITSEQDATSTSARGCFWFELLPLRKFSCSLLIVDVQGP